MTEVVNRLRHRKINTRPWREFANHALQALGLGDRDMTIVLVSDQAIKRLNRQFRGKDYPTDVLSFPTKPEPFENENDRNLGEVVISLQRAVDQAKQHRLSFQREVEQLILHGMLHLSGYDHETDNGEMNRLELKLRKRLGI